MDNNRYDLLRLLRAVFAYIDARYQKENYHYNDTVEWLDERLRLSKIEADAFDQLKNLVDELLANENKG